MWLELWTEATAPTSPDCFTEGSGGLLPSSCLLVSENPRFSFVSWMFELDTFGIKILSSSNLYPYFFEGKTYL